MRIGVPKELMNNENRVGVTPSGVLSFVNAGHDVYVETLAGEGAGFSDDDYRNAGAVIVPSAKEVWSTDIVMKVKAPISEEYEYFYEGLVLFAYLHLAAEKELTKQLVDKKVTAIAYETVQLEDESLPLLTPMSEIAGSMATQIGAQFLEKSKGGKGVLLSGIPGVKRGKVTVIGGGVVGTNAAKTAVGLGANVTIIGHRPQRLRELDEHFGSYVNTIISNPMNIAREIKDSDIVIGAVLIPGAKAPNLVTDEMVRSMEPGSVIIDVSIDQGGIFETGHRTTTHDNPTYKKYEVIHYAVPNIPGNVPKTSSEALTNATIPYALHLAEKGFKQACLDDHALMLGLNTLHGHVTSKGVAAAHEMEYTKAITLLR